MAGKKGKQWTFRNLGNGNYLTYNESQLREGTRVITSATAFGWDVSYDDEHNGFRYANL
jgi:hypothetical protein